MSAFLSRRNPLVGLALLAVLLAGLIAADRALDREDREARLGRVSVKSFLSPEESDELLVAAVTVTAGDGRSFLYGRTDGVWRCLDQHQVPASEAAIAFLLDTVRDARGIVQSRDAQLAAEYGFESDTSWRITFHGPALMKDADRDVRLEVEVGAARPAVDGCFLRRPGDPSIWAVDSDPRAVLDDLHGGVPLLDPSLVPAVFPGEGHTVVAAEVERSDNTRYALVMRQLEVTPQQAALGAPSVRWVLTTPDAGDGNTGDGTTGDQAVHPMLSISYLSFLRLAPWEQLLDPARLQELGLDTPIARVMLRADDGRSLALVVGPPDAQGLHAVANVTLQCAYFITSEVAALLAPDPEQLIFATRNPWERWLQAPSR